MKNDATLVAKARANGPEAFGPIIRRYKDIVFGVALARVRNFHDAEDIAQMVFIYAFEGLHALKDPSRLGAWLRTITINRCIDHQRRHPPVLNLEEADGQESSAASPQIQLEAKELRNQVMAAMNRLSKVQRETVALFYISDYSHQKIAAVQGGPVGTIKSRLHQAKQRLKEEMMQRVSDTLKRHAPDEAFDVRVFTMLSRYPKRNFLPSWPIFVNTLKDLEAHGKSVLSGVQKALASPHWPTRAYTMKVLRNMTSLSQRDLEPLFQQALNDSNRHVRRHAASALLQLAEKSKKKRKDIIPLVIPLLQDPSNNLRRLFARRLCAPQWASILPIEAVSKALLQAPNPRTRNLLEQLLRHVIEHHQAETS